jgi:hypothetical protein
VTAHRNGTKARSARPKRVVFRGAHTSKNERDPRHLPWVALVFWGMYGLEKRWLQAPTSSDTSLNENLNQLLQFANHLVTHWR